MAPSAAHTHVVVDDLFANPPDDPETVTQRLADVDPAAARTRIVARLRDPALGRVQAGVASHMLAVLGHGDARDELVAVLEDVTLSEHARNAVIPSLSSLAPDELLMLMSSLSTEAIDAIMRLPLREMVAAVQADPARARELTDALRGVSAEQRPMLLADFAAARRELGVRAADLYRHALGNAEIAGDARLRDPMLGELVDDADDAAVVLLRALREKAPKKLRAPFQAAVVRVEEALAGGERAKPAAAGVEAWASHPDGQGAIVVLVSQRNPDGTLMFVNLCLRLTGDLRSAILEPRTTRSERDTMLNEFSAASGIEFARAPVGEVLQLIDEAVARGVAMRAKPDADMRRGVELLARLARAEAPPPTPGRAVNPGEVQRLLALRRHDAWYFDRGDLTSFGVSAAPAGPGDARAWSDRTLRALAASSVRPRVIAMARYMARWALWRSDADEAALWTTLADGVERDFATSPLAVAMVDNSMDPSMGKRSYGDAPRGLASFMRRFPEVAATETRTLFLEGQGPIPSGAYELHEFYCDDPGCDCDRVQLHVFARDADDYVAVIGHAFTAEAARAEGLAQTFVDPLHASAPYADALCAVIARVLRDDTAYHHRLQTHYAMMKPAAQRAAPAPRAMKVGPNDPCPCGSGKKYKKCCRP